MPEPRILLCGLAFGESPRWHQDRLWFSNWGTQEVRTVNLDGASEGVASIPTTIPFSLDWLPDGRLLVVSGQEALLLRREPDGSLVTHADLSGLDCVFNEIVVDGRGNAYVNGTVIALVTPQGAVRQVADGLSFGNGMVVTPDNSTLIVAESHGNRLTASTLPLTIASRTGGCGPTSTEVSRTASASIPNPRSGTPTFPTSAACVCVKVVRCCRRSTSTVARSRACSEVLTHGRCSSWRPSGAVLST
jgi:sugar lactone lactonase YvrE